MIEHQDVRKALKVLQPGPVAAIDFKDTAHPHRSCRLDGHVLDIVKWAVDHAYRRIDNAHRCLVLSAPGQSLVKRLLSFARPARATRWLTQRLCRSSLTIVTSRTPLICVNIAP